MTLKTSRCSRWPSLRSSSTISSDFLRWIGGRFSYLAHCHPRRMALSIICMHYFRSCKQTTTIALFSALTCSRGPASRSRTRRGPGLSPPARRRPDTAPDRKQPRSHKCGAGAARLGRGRDVTRSKPALPVRDGGNGLVPLLFRHGGDLPRSGSGFRSTLA
jgi:hypothetical protein